MNNTNTKRRNQSRKDLLLFLILMNGPREQTSHPARHEYMYTFNSLPCHTQSQAFACRTTSLWCNHNSHWFGRSVWLNSFPFPCFDWWLLFLIRSLNFFGHSKHNVFILPDHGVHNNCELIQHQHPNLCGNSGEHSLAFVRQNLCFFLLALNIISTRRLEHPWKYRFSG